MTCSDNDLIQKGQDDLIRRGDAIAALNSVALSYGATWEPHSVKLCKDAISAIPSTQVSVKPLEWVYDEMRGVWSAQDGFGRHYTVSDSQWFHGSLSEFIWVDGGDEAAKAAAQADYEARIRSALTAQPSPDVAALVATLRDALLWTADYEDRAGWRGKARAALAEIKSSEAAPPYGLEGESHE